ncbi:MAG: tRNA (adenosine(37)-N6)-threonylcarbamoyltransferase complex ATPase subunit type 1 TsaE [Bacteroides sp.]|nr:tRNA (adenosine(37)-N6)-threonylcarbamoyltransferase complex ATPase subunit type 1 TsaE [Bacteroidales bacterium]MBD5250600.1 tRNA (adenosine(37)-N6)-threonylcarbamoyltransferase complex ATPase subunit type 1 TsaE [Barnesiella sp.]MBD5252773.1 tRNA (adenosine(37)-N6)-threonylcarbamoyltransferase complex ATPase subunit type 1 TsaE [Barnesiella sp.]MBD5344824.1 tRNA (adenosine(37)-N6)-threonylcarbamoyltransferase complex ATPase subunit type 1 TsaE [Bacteroides sp.]MBD5368572.1 tRNA (adenosine(
MTTITLRSTSDLPEAAQQFVSAMQGRTIFAFHGQMGAGKTTFINAVSAALGARPDDTASPTFAIINEYPTPSGTPVYHFDLYRIDSPEQALDLGLDDYFYSGAPCLMEWPENIEEFLPDDTVHVYINVLDDDSRQICF